MLRVVHIDDKTGDALHHEAFRVTGARVLMQHEITHGMICASVFLEFAPMCEVNYVSLNDYSEYDMSFDAFAEALDLAIKMEPDLICMSIGSTNYFCLEHISKLIKQAAQKSIVMICACSNENVVTYPASLHEVIGVRFYEDNSCLNGQYRIVDAPLDGIEMLVSLPRIHTVDFLAKSYNIAVGNSNSIAAQYAAAIACRHLQHKRFSKSELLELIAKDAVTCSDVLAAFRTSYDPAPSVVVCYQCESEFTKSGIELQRLFLNDGYCCGISGASLKTDLTNLCFNTRDFLSDADPLRSIIDLAKLDIIIVADEGDQKLLQNRVDVYIKDHCDNKISFPDDTLIISQAPARELHSIIISTLT